MTELDRLIALEGAFNLRDLGGYPTADGRTTKWRTLFRADGLHRLTDADRETVRALGLHTVVDLRTDDEVAAGRFPGELTGEWFHLSVVDVLWDRDSAPAGEDAFDTFLFERYQEMLARGGEHFGRAVVRLAERDALPGLFHCAAGKDRTGLLSALLLSALGVPDDVVIADYALSRDAMDRLVTWAADEHPDLAARIDEIPAAHLAADPEAMRRLLVWITEDFGSVRRYLATLGVGDDVVESLASSLLEERGPAR